MRSFFILTVALVPHVLFAQITDDFDDGDFTDGSPLMWNASQLSGSDDFIISSGEVQSTGPAATADLFLSTNLAIDFTNNDVTWTFKAQYASGAPSGSNRIEVYLISDLQDVSSMASGYYIGMGESGSGDGIDLFKTGTSAEIINDANDLVGAGIDVHIRVTRSSSGLWTLEADPTGGNAFSVIGTVEDVEFTAGAYFGFYVKHSSTRNRDFYFDDFSVTVTPIPDTTPPSVQSLNVVSDTEITVQFSEDMDMITTQDAINYRLNGGVSISSTLQDSDPSIVRINTSPLTNGAYYTLTISDVEDVSGNAIATDTEVDFRYLVTEDAEFEDVVISEFLADPVANQDDFVELYNRSEKFINLEGWTLSDESSTSPTFPRYILEPDGYLIIYDEDALMDYPAFGASLTIPSLTLNNSNDQVELRDSNENRMAFVQYEDQPDEGISFELVNPFAPCISALSYRASTSDHGFTPGTQNAVFDDTPDTTIPVVSSFSFTNSLIIHFSEVMDAVSLLSGNYAVSDGLTIQSVDAEADFPTSVEIVFNESVVLGQTYNFTVAGVLDCAGNAMDETTLTFSFGRPPAFNELLITEVLFDEDPSVGLPEREFIEVYNAADEVISTEGISLTDATKTVELPAFNLNPGAYAILTSSAGADEFSIPAIGVSGFPSLSNSGELLSLSYKSMLIFSIDYDPEWHDPLKEAGGYTLEMVDLTNPCVESNANWTSSKDDAGGTPGEVNSVSDPESVPDNMGPDLMQATAIQPNVVLLEFDEKIDPQTVTTGTYIVEPAIEIATAWMPLDQPKSIQLQLAGDLKPNAPYRIRVSQVSDCNGNQIHEDEQVFALPISAEQGEVKLSEVLFNPRTNGVDFVEIYNSSDNYISLKDWQLATIKEGAIEDLKALSMVELVLDPKAYLAITTDAQALFINYPKGEPDRFLEVPSLPTYSNDEGIVVLLNAAATVQEIFEYQEDFHYSLLESVDGVSLERVSFAQPVSQPDNWRSASSTVGFATPGYTNSQSLVATNTSGKVSADPEVFIPGNRGSGRDFTTINYQMDAPGKFANISIYDQNGRLVKSLAHGSSLSMEGFFRWDGDTNSGKMTRMGYYLILFEIYDSNGHSEIIRETVAVGRDF